MQALHKYTSSSRGDHFEMPWKTVEVPVDSRKVAGTKLYYL